MSASTVSGASPYSDLLQSAVWGSCRNVAVQTLLYPMEVVKIHQHCSSKGQSGLTVALELLRRQGIRPFYRGIIPQLKKTASRQVWCWPMITGLPDRLKAMGLSSMWQQACTGVAIATADALLTAPLERERLLAIINARQPHGTAESYTSRWDGLPAYWAKRSVAMASFLTAQQALREHHRQSDGRLPLTQQTSIGIQVALIVSIVTAPFDIISTLRQTRGGPAAWRASLPSAWTLYRGWPIYAFNLTIHNVASLMLLEHLQH